MFRTVFIAAFAYAWGAPGFADVRPKMLDGALVNFHQEVKLVAGDAVAAVKGVDAVRDLHFMDGYFDAISQGVNR